MAEALLEKKDPHLLAVPELKLAERLIYEACQSQVAAVTMGAAHVMRAGGKRLRPLVLILSAKACGFEGAERPARLGAAVELVHTATLVHDDVVDESDLRRGQEAVNTFLGNEASVLVGDYLVCRALRMIAEESDLRMMRAMCDVIVSMCEAEVLQITYRGDIENTFENYLRVIRNKTACLFSFTSMAGALLAAATEEEVEGLRVFGMNLGIAFQIVDDILDMLGDERELGKPTASDLREGKFTYPILHAIQESQGENRRELLGYLCNVAGLSSANVGRVVELVRASGGFDAAHECASGYLARSLEALEILPDSAAAEALRTLAHQILERRV